MQYPFSPSALWQCWPSAQLDAAVLQGKRHTFRWQASPALQSESYSQLE